MQQKQFQHKFLPKLELKRIDTDQGRFYETPDGTFPSVTTVLKQRLSQESLERWRENVGEAYANKVATQARRRGTALHNILESYMMNDITYDQDVMPINLEAFSRIQRHLDEHVTTVYGIEYPLYSTELKTAGTADLIVDWDQKRTILDLKTARKLKKVSFYFGYFVQATCYGLMLNERLGEPFIEQIVVLMLPDDSSVKKWPCPLTVFQEKTKALFS